MYRVRKGTYGVIRVVEAEAPHDADLWPRERREQLLHGEDGRGDLCRRVERRACNLTGFDDLSLGVCQTDWNGVDILVR